MADQVLWQNAGSDFSETTAGKNWARSNVLDYVEQGFSFTLNAATPSLDIQSGSDTDNLAHLSDSDGRGVTLDMDDRTGLSLTDSATNYVYVAFTPSNTDDIYIHIDTDDSAPSGDPSLKIGEVDTSADTTTELNRDPQASFRDLFTDPTVVYVRSGGDDGNDGLSPGSAKATISAAIDDAPLPGNSDSLIVDIDNATYSERVQLDITTPIARVHLRGATDGSNNPATVIDGSGSADALQAAEGAYVLVENCELQAGSNQVISLLRGGGCTLKNSTVTVGGAGWGVLNAHGSALRVESDATFDNTASGTDALISTIADSDLQFRGSLNMNGDENFAGITVREDSHGLIENGATLDGGGTSGYIVKVPYSSNIEVQDCTFQNGTGAVWAEQASNINAPNANTTYNTTTDIKVSSLSHVRDANNNKWMGLPLASSFPIADADLGGRHEGNGLWRDDLGVLEVYAHTAYSETVTAGRVPDVVAVEKGGTDQSISSNTFATVTFGTEVTDLADTWDAANDQFSPAVGGLYRLDAQVLVQVNSDQDTIDVRLQDTSASSTVALATRQASGTASQSFALSRLVDLTAGNTHELQVRNRDNADTVVGNATYTYLSLSKAKDA